jgi:hypothetical protein
MGANCLRCGPQNCSSYFASDPKSLFEWACVPDPYLIPQ